MFSCVVHNWNSHSAPCPMCFPDTYTSASGSEDDTVIINRDVDYWMGKYYKVDEQLTLAIDALQESQHEADENYKKFMNMTASAATYKAAFDQQIIEIAQQESDISVLLEKNESLKETLSHFHDGTVHDQITTLQSSLKEKDQFIEKLKQDIYDQYEEEHKLKTEIEELKAENERLQKIVDIVNDRPDL